MKEEIIAGLDVGSTNIRLVISQRVATPDGDSLQVIGAVSSPTMGVSNGNVLSIDDATSAISACLEKAERLIGAPLSNVWLSFNSPAVKCEKSKGVVVVSKSDGEIDENDVDRAMEAAKSMVVPNNYEILHVIPIKFTIDNQEEVRDPIGMSGVRLEVETLIILGLTNQIKNLTKAVYRTRLNIDGLVLSSLALGEAALDNRQKDLGVALVNIGATTTSLSVYEEGNLLQASILKIGSNHITNDLAIGLRCPINLAERVKIEYGDCESDHYGKKDEISLKPLLIEENLNDDLDIVSRKYISEIIEARVEEIFEMIDVELKKIDRSGMLPAGVILVGGGSQLQGIVETAKRCLRLPVAVGEARNIIIPIEKAKNQEFLTAMGLVIWGKSATPGFSNANNFKQGINQVWGKVQDVFKKIMPQ